MSPNPADLPRRPLWLLRRDGHVVEADVRESPLGPWLSITLDGRERFSRIFEPGEQAELDAEVEAQRRNYEARGFVALRPT